MSKKSKRRNCPALGRAITPAECGEGRESLYACPADCPHNPFGAANYDQGLEVERNAQQIMLSRLREQAPDRMALDWEFSRASREISVALPALIHWQCFCARVDDGSTFAERWERAGFPGLNNDERIVTRGMMRGRVALLEIHRVLDHMRMEAVDLLDPSGGSFLLCDRAVASRACRFTCLLTLVFPLPHFHRVKGTALTLEEMGDFSPLEVLREIIRHLGGPEEGEPMRRWLAEHLALVEKAVAATANERQRLMFAQLDASFGKRVYELKRPFAECRARLLESPEVDEDTLTAEEGDEGFAQACVWCAREEDHQLVNPAPPGAQRILGRVLMGQSHWRIECIGAEKLAALRDRFETLMGDRVRFAGERLDDLGKRLANDSPTHDLSLVPPRLIEKPNVMRLSASRVPRPIAPVTQAEMEAETSLFLDREFLNTPVPALNNRTPREAAKDPVLRPVLLRLIKARIRSADQRNLEIGSNYDPNWLVRELGLNEILFEAPPAGRTPAPPLSMEEAEEEEDEEWMEEDPDEDCVAAMDYSLPPAPPLPKRAFTEEEARARLREAVVRYELASDAIEAMEQSGCTLIADVDRVTAGLLDDEMFHFLVPHLIPIWHTFVPPGTRGKNLRRSDLRRAISAELEKAKKYLSPGGAARFLRELSRGRQPALTMLVIEEVMASGEVGPKQDHPVPAAQILLLLVIKAVIDTLDQANRTS